jgi:hypothetical protein
LWTWPIGAWSLETPLRAASWWYVVHSPGGDAVVEADVVVVAVVVGDVGFEDEEQAASRTASATANFLIECRGAAPIR